MTYETYMTQARKLGEQLPPVVVAFGSKGACWAAAQWCRGRKSVHIRVWRTRSKSWTKWRPLRAEEFKRLANTDDMAHFAPDYGPPWDRH